MIARLMLLAALLLGFAGPAAAQEAFRSDRISVTVAGSGPDVVLVPGLSSSPRVWQGLVETLPGYRYHLVQVSGFAGVPAGGNAGDGPVAAPVAEEIARYIGSIPSGRAAVIGHSMGGSIGMMVAARHPERVTRLMVVDMMPFMGAMFMPNATPEGVRPIADQIRTAMASANDAAWQAQASQAINGMIRTESMRAGPIQDSVASDRNVAARSFHELVVTDLRPELSRITAPTSVLYVLPTGAPLTVEQLDQYYAASYANLAGARLQRIDDAAHFIMFDQPERFVTEVRSFLAG